MFVRSSISSSEILPENPNLEYLRKRSKSLLRELKESRPNAKLCEAQRQIAQMYGFPSWPKLKASLGEQSSESMSDAIRALKEGRSVILFDDLGHENEGDFVLAAERASPEAINYVVRKGGGTLCLALPPEQIERLGLTVINRDRSSEKEPAFTSGIDAASGITTGVSAADRATTILAATRSDAGPQSIKTPGHIFPLRAEPGLLKTRRGHTEGSLELMRRAGLRPAAVIIEILNDDGTMARLPDVVKLSADQKIPLLKMSELV